MTSSPLTTTKKPTKWWRDRSGQNPWSASTRTATSCRKSLLLSRRVCWRLGSVLMGVWVLVQVWMIIIMWQYLMWGLEMCWWERGGRGKLSLSCYGLVIASLLPLELIIISIGHLMGRAWVRGNVGRGVTMSVSPMMQIVIEFLPAVRVVSSLGVKLPWWRRILCRLIVGQWLNVWKFTKVPCWQEPKMGCYLYTICQISES